MWSLAVLVMVAMVTAVPSLLLAGIFMHRRSTAPAAVCGAIGLLFTAGLMAGAYCRGQGLPARLDGPERVIMEVLVKFELDDRPYALIRPWDSDEEPRLYELAGPLPPGAECFVYRDLPPWGGRRRYGPIAIRCPQ